MKISQAVDVVARIGAAFKQNIPEPTVKVWAEMLLDLEYEDAVDAVKDAASTENWPSIAAIRNAATKRQTSLPSPDEAWRQVVSSFGGTPGTGCHPLVADVAHCIGWDAIGMSSTEDTWMQKHFIKLYEARAERVMRDANVTPMLEAGKESHFAAIAKGVTKALPE